LTVALIERYGAKLRPRERGAVRFGASFKALAADPKYIGTPSPGFFGVLHTWGRQLPYHPHLHFVMPGGGPNIFRVAISDHRIHACDDHNVTFTWRKSGSRRPRSLRLEAHEFLRRFLQHVLPRGFQKVRYYGFLSPNASNSLDRARWLATLHARETFVLEPAHGAPPRLPPRQRCADCGGSLRVLRVLRFRGTARFDSS
jgi:hypothetical protein